MKQVIVLTFVLLIGVAGVRCQDRALESAAKEIGAAVDLSKKAPVAIGVFTNRQGYDNSFSRYIAQNISSIMSHAKPSTVVVRFEDDVRQLMDEKGRSNSSAFDTSFYQSLGKIAGAAAIVCGSYEVEEGVIYLNYKLVQTSNGLELTAGTVDIPRTPEMNKKLAVGKLDGAHALQVANAIGLVAIEHGGYGKDEDDEIRAA